MQALKFLEKMLDRVSPTFIQIGIITFIIHIFKEFTMMNVLTFFLIGFGCAGISGCIASFTSDPEVNKND